MPLRVTVEQVRDHVLAKQFLHPAHPGKDVVSVIRRAGPLRAKPAVTPYLALWSRTPRFRRADLQHALYTDRTLVRIPCVRAHLHVVPAEDLPAYHQATRHVLDGGVASYIGYLVAHASGSGSEPISLETLVPRVLEVLSTRGPCTIDELTGWLPVLGTRMAANGDDEDGGEFRLGKRLIPAMCAQGLVVHAKPRGSWKSELDTYAALSAWLPQMRVDALPGREALRRVVRAYLAAYGPATAGDVVHWLGGARRREVVTALMGLGREVTRIEVLGARGESFVLTEEIPDLLAAALPGRWVRLLPPRDGVMMAYQDTSRFLEPAYRDRAYDWAGESHGVVLVDGAIVGLWWLHSKTDRVVVRLLTRVDPRAMAMIGEEAMRLGEILDEERLVVEVRPDEEEFERDASFALPVDILPAD